MTSPFARHHFGNRRRDWRRVALAVGGLLAISVLWHVVRPAIVASLVRASIGHPTRRTLVRDALRARYPQLLDWTRTRIDVFRDTPANRSYIIAEGLRDPFPGHSPPKPSHFTTAVFGEDLLLLGRISHSLPGYYMSSVQYARGERGSIELCYQGFEFKQGQLVNWLAIVGSRGDDWKLLAFVARRTSLGKAWGTRRRGDGYELVGDPRESEIVLHWQPERGVVVPEKVPDDGSVWIWTPPDGQPLPFAADEPFDGVVARILEDLPPVAAMPATFQPTTGAAGN